MNLGQFPYKFKHILEIYYYVIKITQKKLFLLILDYEGHSNKYLILTGNVAHELEWK